MLPHPARPFSEIGPGPRNDGLGSGERAYEPRPSRRARTTHVVVSSRQATVFDRRIPQR